jgi:FkbM family methyltransferase
MATEQEMAAVKRIGYNAESPTVVELGARIGEDEEWIRQSFRQEIHYVMVEPDIRNCQVIMDKGVHRTRRLIIGAVAQTDGNAEFYGSLVDMNTRGSGSIRRPTKHIDIFPHVEFPAYLHTVVPTFSLDTIFEREWLSKINLLWVDIQGAEKDMILGGQKALSHTQYLFMETEDRELYEGMATKPELLSMLPGWRVIDDFGYNCLLQNMNFRERAPR